MLGITWNLRTSTEELPHRVTEMGWYKEMRQEVSLNANIFLLRSVFPKAESWEKTQWHSSSVSVFPTAENHQRATVIQWPLPSFLVVCLLVFFSLLVCLFFVFWFFFLPRSFYSLKTICPPHTFLILTLVQDAFCIITGSSWVSVISLSSVSVSWTHKKKHTSI